VAIVIAKCTGACTCTVYVLKGLFQYDPRPPESLCSHKTTVPPFWWGQFITKVKAGLMSAASMPPVLWPQLVPGGSIICCSSRFQHYDIQHLGDGTVMLQAVPGCSSSQDSYPLFLPSLGCSHSQLLSLRLFTSIISGLSTTHGACERVEATQYQIYCLPSTNEKHRWMDTLVYAIYAMRSHDYMHLVDPPMKATPQIASRDYMHLVDHQRSSSTSFH